MADELPSHIVAPALHITRERAAELIGGVTGQDLSPDPDTLVRAARVYLRDKFIAAAGNALGGQHRQRDAGEQRGQRPAVQQPAAVAHRGRRRGQARRHHDRRRSQARHGADERYACARSSTDPPLGVLTTHLRDT